jgi:hypothetical protein
VFERPRPARMIRVTVALTGNRSDYESAHSNGCSWNPATRDAWCVGCQVPPPRVRLAAERHGSRGTMHLIAVERFSGDGTLRKRREALSSGPRGILRTGDIQVSRPADVVWTIEGTG